MPDLSADPIPSNGNHSDAHEFTELLKCAEKLDGPEAIEPYEAAQGLYRGDLLDTSDMLGYRWMYDEDPQVALTLRSAFRRQHRDARLRLAELLVNGPETRATVDRTVPDP